MKLLQAIRNNIPNAITSMNLLCGCLACIVAFRCLEPNVLWSLQGYEVAFLFILFAAVADFCDGLSARLLHAVSGIGKELDSLSDSVSFGLAPALVLFNMMQAVEPGNAWSYVSLAIPVFGALRLARFNVDTRQTTTFTGLPIPANALFWIGFISWYATHHEALPLWAVAIIAVAMSLLMVCNLRMFSLKMHNFSLRENAYRYLLVIATVVFVVVGGWVGLAATIIFYVLLSVFAREQ